jgi:hypothetical protein
MKKITLSRIFVAIAAVALLPLTGVTSNSHAATIPDEQFVVGTSQTSSGQELLGLSIADDSTASTAPSWLLADPDGTGNGIKQRLCTSMADINCSNAQSVSYVATLPVCATADSSNCIVGLSAISATGAVVEGKAVKTVPAQGWTDYPGDASLNLPTGASPTLFTIPGVLNGAGTENYLVTFKAFGQKPRSVSKFSTGRVLASISPVTIQSGQYGRMHAVDARNRRADCAQASLPCGLSVDGSSYLDDKACASLDDGSCALKQAFPSGYRFKLVVNLGNSPVGWFHGRIKSPDLSITTISTGIQLSLAADPVTIPTVGTAVPRLSLPANMQAYYKDGLGSQGWSWGDLGPHGLRNQLALPSPSTQEAFDQFQLWSSYFNDKASASPTVWNFQTLDLGANSSSCFRNDSQLIGVVTTNSMMYSGGPPSFNATDGVLEYKVGSPHYKSNGDVFQGSYDLQVRSDVARCLYGFSAAPVKASLTVTSESGAANVASTVVTESGGWLRMAAYGFTFSNPTIKVKLSQDAPVPVVTPTPTATPVVTPTPEPTPTAAPIVQPAAPSPQPTVAAKKITITCIKGKTTKTVTAVKPVCPMGYKKK